MRRTATLGGERGLLRSLAASVAGLVALTCSGCLPDDTRPTPGQVQVQVIPGAWSFDTGDGWRVVLSEVLMGIGALELEGGDCVHYNQTRYTRLFELTLPDAYPQPVGMAYGLGECDLGFDLRPPESNSLLGDEATESDRNAMRVEADDRWVSEPEATSVHVVGEASRGEERKRFDWRFRKQYEIKHCLDGAAGEPGTTMTIDSDGVLQRSLSVDMTSLFRFDDEGDAPLTFAEIAGADGQLDGEVTLEELEAIPSPGDEGSAGGPESEAPSVADRLYDDRVPRMVRPAGSGPCEVEVQ